MDQKVSSVILLLAVEVVICLTASAARLSRLTKTDSMRLWWLTVWVFLAGGPAVSLNAVETNLIRNGGFEIKDERVGRSELRANTDRPIDWEIREGAIELVRAKPPDYDGERAIAFNGNLRTTISQSITGLNVGQLYNFSFRMGGYPEASASNSVLLVKAGNISNSYSSFALEVKAHGVWKEQRLQFKAQQTTTIVEFSARGHGPHLFLDDVELRPVVPLVPLSVPSSDNMFDPAADFSNAETRKGGWFFGSKHTLFGPFVWMRDSKVLKADNGVPTVSWRLSKSDRPSISKVLGPDGAAFEEGPFFAPAGVLICSSGTRDESNALAVVRLAVDSGCAGRYSIEAFAAGAYSRALRGAAEFHILRNNAILQKQSVSAHGTVGYTNQLELAERDVIDFVVGPGSISIEGGAVLTLSVNLRRSDTPRNSKRLEFHDLATEFSAYANPNKYWRYGWKESLHGGLVLLTHNKSFRADNGAGVLAWQLGNRECPGICKVIGPFRAESVRGEFSAAPGTVYLSPGYDGAPESLSAARFTVPLGEDGRYRLEASARDVFDGPSQGDTDFHILINENVIYGLLLAPRSAAAYTNEFNLIEGDTVDFVVGPGWDGKQSGSLLKVSARLTNCSSIHQRFP